MKISGIQIFFVAFFAILISNSNPTTSQEVEDERGFNYVEGSGKGPEDWGDLHENWTLCKNGNMQSPIDLLDERVEVVYNSGGLKTNYKPSHAILKNRGHDIMLSWVHGSGTMRIDKTEYVLLQCHWHSPSEHTINGKRFDLEVHLVHQTSDKNVTVVGIMYKIGPQADPFLSKLVEPLLSIAHSHEIEIEVGVVDPMHLKMDIWEYYRYMGSLTTPPCTEDVVWTVVKEVRSVSLEQVKLLRKAVDDDAQNNARPLQPINERSIKFYKPRLHEQL
ncbi:alpha carbonic anhydrase 7-like [Tasmannia lanceolata]|uniref:alpha carbonic anhydrase 7-like n=1 Tax=Tasmannia lanceolata TaxID=3420 RepID=UPI0040639367